MEEFWWELKSLFLVNDGFLNEFCLASFKFVSGDEFDSDVDTDEECVDRDILTGLNRRLCVVDEEDVFGFEFGLDFMANVKFDCELAGFWVWSLMIN